MIFFTLRVMLLYTTPCLVIYLVQNTNTTDNTSNILYKPVDKKDYSNARNAKVKPFSRYLLKNYVGSTRSKPFPVVVACRGQP